MLFGAPASFGAFVLFILTLVLGLFLSIAIAMTIYIIMFRTTSSKGLFGIFAVFAEFFAGSEIPLPFMPKILQTISYILPFRLILDLPYRLYVGNISITEGLYSVLIQIVWILVIVGIGSLSFEKVTKKLVVQGG